MAIQALVFDAYGTLFDVHSVVARLESLFPGRGQAASQLWRQKQLEYTWLRTLMGRYRDFEAITDEALRHATAALQLALSAEARRSLMQAYRELAPYPEVRDALRGLADCRLAILSNGAPDMLDAVVRHARLDPVFDAVLSVDPVKLYKPHPRVYQIVPERLGVPVAQVGFVSSNYWDVCGAAAFGFQAYWINRGRAVPDALGEQPRAVLERLTDLIGLLDA